MKIVLFVLAYLVFMIPTYLVRYVGVLGSFSSSSTAEDVVAMGGTMNIVLGVLYLILILIAYWRGRAVGKGYIATFPFIGGVFDILLPFIPFVPTVMNILTLVMAMQGQQPMKSEKGNE